MKNKLITNFNTWLTLRVLGKEDNLQKSKKNYPINQNKKVEILFFYPGWAAGMVKNTILRCYIYIKI
jgi:hypothetical protein